MPESRDGASAVDGGPADAVPAIDRGLTDGEIVIITDAKLDGKIGDQLTPGDGVAGDAPADQGGADLGPCGTTHCPLGCNLSAARCNRLRPSTFDPAPLYPFGGLGQLALSGSVQINTTDGSIIANGNVVRAANKHNQVAAGVLFSTAAQSGSNIELAIFFADSINIAQNATVTATGQRALVLYAKQQLTVEQGAELTAAPGQAGGFAGGKVAANAANCGGGDGEKGNGSSSADSGGGGGGHGAAGGTGGAGNSGGNHAPGGNGGTATNSPTLIPLAGGCGGGGGSGAPGGGGGAAIQLIAGAIINILGTLTAPGDGGKGGTVRESGGGGGAGGAILIEAPVVITTSAAIIAANGGGGGSGATDGAGAIGQDGSPGQPGAGAAAGGTSAGNDSGRGGNGGAKQQPQGQTGDAAKNGGGGGGAVGRIRINAQSPQISGSTVLSPLETRGALGTW